MRARYPVLLGLSAVARRWWPRRGCMSAAAGVGDASDRPAARRGRCSAAISPGGSRAASTTRRPPPPTTGEALVRDPGNDVLIEQSFLMELIEGNWPRAEELARELVEGAADAPHGPRLHGPRRLQGAALRGGRRAFQGGQRQSHRRADEHAGARLALSGAGQDPGGAGPPRCAEAAGLGAVLSALSPRAARRSGRAPRRGARRLRAHPQERPAHAAHHARLRAACRPTPAMPSWR